jgi:6-phosphogluconate dehydrogenase
MKLEELKLILDRWQTDNRDAVKKLAGRCVRGAASRSRFIAMLIRPRAVWVLVLAGVAGETIVELASLMEAGDIESRGEADYANRLLSAMRKRLDGHDEKGL